MSPCFVVTGTDTGIGKTFFSAALAGALGAVYWKPVQAGLKDETDSQTVAWLSVLPSEQILPEAYRLRTPASPHMTAELEGVTISPQSLVLPETDRPLVVEGAGGLMVPLTREVTYLDVIAMWRALVVLCARTTLGTINHSLLSIAALRARSVAILGVTFIGYENVEFECIIADMGGVAHLGRLPHLASLTGETLRDAFARCFDISDFRDPA